jgi:DNA polymerase (family X)
MVRTDRWLKLERMRGELDPERLFRSLPGVGAVLARRMHEELHVDTLEALEAAAHDGRLAAVAGVGARRVLSLRAELESALAHVRRGAPVGPPAPGEEPAIDVLLDVDRDYRARAAVHQLATIAPKRFNPAGEAWLPILHAERGPWHFTALFSNTARAHRLGKTGDWVVLYFHHSGARHERQRTVVTESRGPLAGRRVVRGREDEHRVLSPARSATDPSGGVVMH